MMIRSRWTYSILVVVVVALCPSRSFSQVQLGGYFEHTLEIDYTTATNEQILDASKLRLDIASDQGEGKIAFRGNVNFIQYHSDVTYKLSGYLPDGIVHQLQAVGAPTSVTLDRSRIYLDNAWLTWEHNGLRFRAGKQQLSWGPGYSFNPTDLFHRKNIIDPTYEKEGVTALRFDYRWGVGGEASVVAAPGDDFHSTGLALRLGTHIESIGYDVAMTVHRIIDSLSFDPLTLMPRSQVRYALGGEFSGALLGLGTWVEGNYNFMESEDEFVRVVGGLDYTFTNGTYVFTEALFNMRGSHSAPYEASDWLANVFYGEPMGYGWLVTGIRKDLSGLTDGEAYVFASPDGSFLFNPRLTISIAQNADATIFGAVTAGHPDGAFPPGLYSLFARGTVYF